MILIIIGFAGASGHPRSTRAAHGAPRSGAGLRSSRQVAGGAAHSISRRPTRQWALKRTMRRLETTRPWRRTDWLAGSGSRPKHPAEAFRLLSLRGLSRRGVSASCRSKPRFVAGSFRMWCQSFHLSGFRRSLAVENVCSSVFPSSFRTASASFLTMSVNVSKHIRNTNEHSAHSLRNSDSR
jgi:hypothetical protein